MQCVGLLHQWDHLKETRLASAHLANGRQMNRKGINDFRDHDPVRLPGVLQTNVGHSNFRYVSFKKNHII